MEIIFSLIGIVMLISLYDYFSAKNWQQVTSVTRNETVFEKRNKEYGAYALRRDYDKRMLLILFSLLGSVGVTFATIAAFRSNPAPESIETPVVTVSDTTLIIFDHKDEPEITKKTDAAPLKTDVEKFPVISPVDDPIPDEVEPVLPPDGNKDVGNEKQKGNGEFPDGKDGKEGGTGDDDKKETVVIVPEPTRDPDVIAEYIGGRTKMVDFLSRNLMYPEVPKDLGIEAKIYMQFVVKKDGSISNIRVIGGSEECPECAQEAARIIKKMPKWKPGKLNGEVVDSYFMMPINFVLN